MKVRFTDNPTLPVLRCMLMRVYCLALWTECQWYLTRHMQRGCMPVYRLMGMASRLQLSP